MGDNAHQNDNKESGKKKVNRDFNSLDINLVLPDEDQPRKKFNEESLKDLAKSIKNQGLLVPILVRKNDKLKETFVIIAGERRWRASKIAGLTKINVIVSSADKKTSALSSIIENVQREDLNSLEEAEGYNRLIKKHQMKHEEISKYTGKSRSYISNLIRIIGLPDKTKKLLLNNQISFGHARALLGSKDINNLANQIVQKKLSVREIEKIIKNNKIDTYVNKENKVKDANIADYEKYLSLKLGYKVDIKDKKGKGIISVHYNDLEQLEAIVSLFNE